MARLSWVTVCLCSVVKVYKQNQNVDRVNEFASHVLELVRERVVVTNVGKEGSTDKSVDDATRNPFVDKG